MRGQFEHFNRDCLTEITSNVRAPLELTQSMNIKEHLCIYKCTEIKGNFETFLCFRLFYMNCIYSTCNMYYSNHIYFVMLQYVDMRFGRVTKVIASIIYLFWMVRYLYCRLTNVYIHAIQTHQCVQSSFISKSCNTHTVNQLYVRFFLIQTRFVYHVSSSCIVMPNFSTYV